MERFFTPTRRLPVGPVGYTEVELTLSTEAFLNQRWDWSDVHTFATGGEGGEMWKILWMAEDAFMCVEDTNAVGNNLLELYSIQRATFTATSGETHEFVNDLET
jgi:hypothetical protein